MKRNKAQVALNRTAETLGASIIAGFAGTVAITVSQMIEMQITKRKAGVGPANAVEKTLHILPKPGTKKKLANEIHWVYGTLWGLVHGLLSAFGINKWLATGIHYTAITGTGMAVAPLEGQSPVTDWRAGEIAVDMIHHAVYAITVGCVFNAIVNDK